MRIEKRSMNWMPKASAYNHATSINAKQRKFAKVAIAQTESLTATFSSISGAKTSGAIDITLQVAADRIRADGNAKIEAAKARLDQKA